MASAVIIIRHGEKLDWKDGLLPTSEIIAAFTDHEHNLSPKGNERAHALVGYFCHRGGAIRNLIESHPIAAIVAQDADLKSGHGLSTRCKDTVMPLYSFLKTQADSGTIDEAPVLKLFVKSKMAEAVNFLKTDPTLAGKTAILCWSHRMIPSIVDDIKQGTAENSSSSMEDLKCQKWPKGGRFDLTWVLTRNPNASASNAMSLQKYPQLLLYGDRTDV